MHGSDRICMASACPHTTTLAHGLHMLLLSGRIVWRCRHGCGCNTGQRIYDGEQIPKDCDCMDGIRGLGGCHYHYGHDTISLSCQGQLSCHGPRAGSHHTTSVFNHPNYLTIVYSAYSSVTLQNGALTSAGVILNMCIYKFIVSEDISFLCARY